MSCLFAKTASICLRMGKEIHEVDGKDPKLLGIDVGWGLHNVNPETLMETALEINSLVGRICQDFHVAVI